MILPRCSVVPGAPGKLGCMQAVDVVVEAAQARAARLIGITGGVAAGKSTLAAAVADRLGAAVVATDGFLFDNATLAERGLAAPQGVPRELRRRRPRSRSSTRWWAIGRATAPVYSHLAYDVVGTVEVDADRLVVEGLHLGHPELARARPLRPARARRRRRRRPRPLVPGPVPVASGPPRPRTPTAFLHRFRDLPPDMLDQMAMEVWARRQPRRARGGGPTVGG